MKKKFLALGVAYSLFALAAWSKDFVTTVRTVHSSSTLTTSSWTQIVSALSAKVTAIDVYNSSTSGTLQLGVGASGAEVRYLYIQAGESRIVPVTIVTGQRVSLKAVDATVNTGDSQLNFMGRD